MMAIDMTMQFHLDDDTPFVAHMYYDRGEKQWFDVERGVGGPGYEPFIRVYEVDFGRGWENPACYPQIDVDALEDEAMRRLFSIQETMYDRDC